MYDIKATIVKLCCSE